jgi:hypothetical protein
MFVVATGPQRLPPETAVRLPFTAAWCATGRRGWRRQLRSRERRSKTQRRAASGTGPFRHWDSPVPGTPRIAGNPRQSARPANEEAPRKPLQIDDFCRADFLHRTQEVGGSSPPSSTRMKPLHLGLLRKARLWRALLLSGRVKRLRLCRRTSWGVTASRCCCWRRACVSGSMTITSRGWCSTWSPSSTWASSTAPIGSMVTVARRMSRG